MLMKLAKSAGLISTKQELAMFTAQIMWESGGLRVSDHVQSDQI